MDASKFDFCNQQQKLTRRPSCFSISGIPTWEHAFFVFPSLVRISMVTHVIRMQD